MWRGRSLVGALLLSRVLALSIGCGSRPAVGQEGGACEDNGCNTYCDGSGLSCDNSTNTCVAMKTYPVPDEGSCSELLAAASCAEGSRAVCIDSWAAAGAPVATGACAVSKRDELGDTLLCCDTTHPYCTAESFTCSAPATDYDCTGAAPPDVGDASMICGALTSDDAGAEYCCGPANGCTFVGYSREPSCAPEDAEFFCGGGAVPVWDTPCAAVSGIDAGGGATLASTYCCSGTVGDGGG